ncbi:MAG: hypothetical protein KGL17_07985, partial [Betaproteobacteria bacterium]|nr:hypothetical protein [Betaproteobacteria bacterium]
MREFKDFQAFVRHLSALEQRTAGTIAKAATAAAIVIEAEAKSEIGTYQEGAGPFVAWQELADSTKRDRVAKGFTENDPGLRTGAMRDSIEHATDGAQAFVGSNDDHLVWFEQGTRTQPPRSVLGLAAVNSK